MREIRVHLADDKLIDAGMGYVNYVGVVPLKTYLTQRILFAATSLAFGVVFTYFGFAGFYILVPEVFSSLRTAGALFVCLMFMVVGPFMLLIAPEFLINRFESRLRLGGCIVTFNQTIFMAGLKRVKSWKDNYKNSKATVQLEAGRRETWSYFVRIRIENEDVEITQRNCGPENDEDFEIVKRSALDLAEVLCATGIFGSVEVCDCDAHVISRLCYDQQVVK